MEKRERSVLKNFFVGSNAVSRTAHKWGVISGVVISSGFGLLRVARAADVGEILFASALTIVEVGAIGFLEWKAQSLRAAGREWNLKRAGEASAQSRVQNASANVTRLQERLKALDDDINKYIAYVGAREFNHANLPQLVGTAQQTIIRGYEEGIAGNRARVLQGRVLGATSKE